MNDEWERNFSFLSGIGEELLEEESHREHIFSQDYIRRKRELLDRTEKEKKRGKALTKAAVVFIFCCIVPVTAVAAVFAGKYVMRHGEPGEYAREYTLERADGADRDVKHVKITTEFPPEYRETEHLKWETEDGKSLSMALLFVTAGGGNISMENVLYTQELDLDGVRGVYHEYQSLSVRENPFDKMAVVFYEELGYVLEIYGTENIGRTEFMALTEQVSLTETTPEEADMPGTVLSNKNDVPQTDRKAENDIIEQGTVFAESFPTIEGGMAGKKAAVNILVSGIRTAVSVNELEGGSFDGNFLELAGVDEDGVVRYPAQIVKRGDGRNSLDEVVGEKTIERRFLVLTMELENATENDVEYWLGGGQFELETLKEREDDISLRPITGFWAFANPVWSAGTQTERLSAGETQSVFTDCVVLKSGEKKSIQIAFSVAEEELGEDLYLRVKDHLVKILK